MPFVNSCNHNSAVDEKGIIAININDFEEIEIDQLSGKLVSDDVAFGNAAFIKVVNDSIIAVKLVRTPEQVVLYNLKSGKSQTAVATGKGPQEMLRVATMSVTPDGDLTLVGSSDKKVMTVKWSDNDNVAMTNHEFTLPVDALAGVSCKLGKVAILPTYYKNARALITGCNDSTLISLGSFPIVEMPDSIKANNAMFQSDIAYSFENDCVVISTKTWNFIEIINLTDSTSKILRGPDYIDSRIVERKIPNGKYYQQDPMWFYYSCLSAGPKTFAVGYIGTKVEKDEDFEKKINRILEFDYSGKPLRSYNFSHDIEAFDIDYANRILYTIEERDEPVIMKYSLPD